MEWSWKHKFSSWRRHRCKLINERPVHLWRRCSNQRGTLWHRKTCYIFLNLSMRLFYCSICIRYGTSGSTQIALERTEMKSEATYWCFPLKQLILIYGVIGWESWVTQSAHTVINNAHLKWSSVIRSHEWLNEVLLQIEMIWKKWKWHQRCYQVYKWEHEAEIN